MSTSDGKKIVASLFVEAKPGKFVSRRHKHSKPVNMKRWIRYVSRRYHERLKRLS